MLTVRTGPLTTGGKQMELGLEAFLKERGGMLSGRKVEVIYADTAATPAIALSKTQELVERNKVHVLIGPVAAFEALAIDDYIRKTQTPIISASAAAEDLTQRQANPWFVRTSATSAQPAHPLADYAAKTLGYKRIAIVAEDLAFGYEAAGGFQRVFEEQGGKIVQKLWTPFNTADYSPYISQIKNNVDAVYVQLVGPNAVRFMRQYQEYGLQGKIPVLGGVVAFDESILKSMGDESVGAISASYYSAATDNPASHKYVAEMLETTGNTPGVYSIGSYTAGLLLEEALKKTGGKIDDKNALMSALRTAKVSGDPRGNISIDDYGNINCDITIRRVDKKDGKLVNTILKTYPQVSQFWTYDPKAFLANPVYSRDFPPAKNLE
jgi:branched-chain amino acid transport system substrate-binding protein